MNLDMNAQIPLPSFDDMRKLLNFWIDQQDKWFYFEGTMYRTGSRGRITHSPSILARSSSPWDDTDELVYYAQSRIVGRIHDIVNYPPSLLLSNALVYTAFVSAQDLDGDVKRPEERAAYGLVFSQIAYYEPIKNIEKFLLVDPRVWHKPKESTET